MKQCPHCHQPLPERRAGVRLSRLKAHIFDVIKRSDREGVPLDVINTLCFDGNSTAANIRVHINQINDLLWDSGLFISGRAVGMKGLFHLVKRRR